MCDYIGLQCNVFLTSNDDSSLSQGCRYIAENRSERFLGFLKHVWEEQRGLVMGNENVLTELKSLPVNCTNGTSVPLSDCYMPLEELQSVCKRFADEEVMPFLDIESYGEADASGWAFLTRDLGVRRKNNLDFRISLLRAVTVKWGDALTEQQTLKVIKLYQYIEAYCVESPDPQGMRDSVL